MKIKSISRSVALEYQKAQDSAEHYNLMIWTLISVGIGFSLLILKIVWFEENGPFNELILLFMGFFSLFYFSFLIESANEKKNLKYSICKRIELDYNFIGQNVLTERLPLSKARFKGIHIFRIMKLVLFFLYLISVMLIGIIAIFKESFPNLTLLALIFVFPAIIGAIIMEGYYNSRKFNLKGSILKDEKQKR